MPLVKMRPSPLAPPCAVKNIMLGVVGAVAAPAPATPPIFSDGTVASAEPTSPVVAARSKQTLRELEGIPT